MSDQQKPSSFVAENGITLGVIVLSLFVIFGVGLPRWIHEDTSPVSQSKIKLPDSLAGGYVAADLPTTRGSIKDQSLGAQLSNVTAGIATSDKDLAKTSPGATTRLYLKVKSGQLAGIVNVQAFHGDGSGFAPGDLGVGSAKLESVGDGVCITRPDSSGQSQEMEYTCQRAGDGTTVQVYTVGGTADDLMKIADGVHDKVA